MDPRGISDEILDRIEERVAEVENQTTVEVVVAIAQRSDSYRDIAILVGAAVASLALIALLYLPVDFPAPAILPLTLLGGFVGTWVASRTPILLAALALGDRRVDAARSRAREAFVEEAVSATRDRTGLLLFVSLLEHRVELIPDFGLDARIARGEWNRIASEAEQARGWESWDTLVDELLTRVAPLLAREFPATDDNPDEISNRPRVLR
jgi:putative membrane protein